MGQRGSSRWGKQRSLQEQSGTSAIKGHRNSVGTHTPRQNTRKIEGRFWDGNTLQQRGLTEDYHTLSWSLLERPPEWMVFATWTPANPIKLENSLISGKRTAPQTIENESRHIHSVLGFEDINGFVKFFSIGTIVSVFYLISDEHSTGGSIVI